MEVEVVVNSGGEMVVDSGGEVVVNSGVRWW